MLRLRLVSFNPRDVSSGEDSSTDDGRPEGGGGKPTASDKRYEIQMFGLDRQGSTYSVTATGFTPYFYVKVSDDWMPRDKTTFASALQEDVDSDYFQDAIVSMKLIRRRTLYGVRCECRC